MRNLQAAWATLFGLGVILVAIDTVSDSLLSIKGVPALGVIGAALILLVLTSMLNWMFKGAWNERTRSNANNP
jgi:hypothetical protein